MKSMQNKKREKIILIASLSLLILVLTVLLTPTIIKSQTNKFNMSKNDDNGFYTSAQGHIMYCDKSLSVYNHNTDAFDIYTDSNKESVTCEVAKYYGYEIATDDNGLKIKGTDTEYSIKGDTCSYHIAGDNVVYKVNSKELSIFNLKTQSTNTLNTEYEINWFSANENSIFTANHKDTDTFMVESFSINTLEKTNSFSGNILGNTTFLLCNNDVYIVTPPAETINIFKINFETQQLENLHTHSYVNNITSTDKYIIFSAEKYSTLDLVTHTVEHEDNGLWAYDVANKKLTKLSEECVFSDLLATENYVYGLVEEYLLPRGLTNKDIGYKITEIKID